MFRLLERLLSPAEVHVTMPARASAVFDVISDPETYPSWLAGAQRIRRVDPAFPAPGARFDHEVGPTDDVTVADDSVAVKVRPPERLDLEVHVGPVSGRVEFHLLDKGGETEVCLREVMCGPFRAAMPLLRPLLHGRNRGSLERLRDRYFPG